MKRSAGILLNISSLPGQFGIGGLSDDAERFIEDIASMGFTVWQTLPVTAIGLGNSPYSGISSYAGNYLYIDPNRIDNLTKEEIASARYPGDMYLTDYDYARKTKRYLLELAYGRLDEKEREKVVHFYEINQNWLSDYAVFMTLKEKYNYAPWTEWSAEDKFYSSVLVNRVERENSERTGYYFFEQYTFYTQWERIMAYAHGRGVQVFGDLPIYVCLDSVDVWADADKFLLDKELRPLAVAGVPPDYFAKDGQLWGNPLYDYEKMKKDGFKWWVKRLAHALKLYDILRIDHFRGLYEYWSVSAESKTAKDGVWKNGPRHALFDALKKAVPKHCIVAEDLGIIDEKVSQFLTETGYYGMRVMQFGFDGDTKNKHLPHNYVQECVAYTGTHDNDTTLGWLQSLSQDERTNALAYVNCEPDYGWANGGGRCRATKAFIRALFSSCARLAIVPMQDLCGYGSDTRMNIPGVADGCWRYRTNYGAMDNVDRDFVRNSIDMYGR